MPVVHVSALARAHGLSPPFFGWRRNKARAQARTLTETPEFAVVALAEEEKKEEADDTVELVVGEVTVRVGPDLNHNGSTSSARRCCARSSGSRRPPGMSARRPPARSAS